jgi:hypothetical protein
MDTQMDENELVGRDAKDAQRRIDERTLKADQEMEQFSNTAANKLIVIAAWDNPFSTEKQNIEITDLI